MLVLTWFCIVTGEIYVVGNGIHKISNLSLAAHFFPMYINIYMFPFMAHRHLGKQLKKGSEKKGAVKNLLVRREDHTPPFLRIHQYHYHHHHLHNHQSLLYTPSPNPRSLPPLQPLPPWASEIRLVSLLFYGDLSLISFYKLISKIPSRMCLVNKTLTTKKVEISVVEEDTQDLSVLDLPELVLECILERLSPPALCKMAGVCRSLRERCVSDYFWERHMKQKWGRVIGPAAYRQWQCHIASKHDDVATLRQPEERGLFRFPSLGFWPLSWIRLLKAASNNSSSMKQSSLPTDSVMTWYLALESGSFWFPAQVYNRENGHVGFMLSCYDAELSYDPRTDAFQARYPPHGGRAVAIENGIPWERLRAPPVDTSPRDLYISDCLNDLRPGDHIEIQWRRNKEFPYGWWYGVVGHLESCDGNETYCRCHNSDTVVLVFNQYAPGSRWRRATVSRKDYREEGNEADGFYGGIRKINDEHEISMWKHLWPSEVLD